MSRQAVVAYIRERIPHLPLWFQSLLGKRSLDLFDDHILSLKLVFASSCIPECDCHKQPPKLLLELHVTETLQLAFVHQDEVLREVVIESESLCFWLLRCLLCTGDSLSEDLDDIGIDLLPEGYLGLVNDLG